MYLTRLEINQRRRASRQLLASPHRLHGAVMSCFPRSENPGRPLWRVDDREDGVFLYVLSEMQPDATGLVEDYGWPLAEPPWQARKYTPVLEAVQDGREFNFRLRANPVRNVQIGERAPKGGRPRGKRVGHVTVAQQREWLVSRAQAWGFTIGESANCTAEVVDRKVWTFPKNGRTVTVSTAAFEGTLSVTDAGLLRRRLVEGFGPAKAYGCGLMTLAPSSRA